MTITVYNEAGEIVTDPNERARIFHGLLWSPIGLVVVYDDDGNEAGRYPPADSSSASAPPTDHA